VGLLAFCGVSLEELWPARTLKPATTVLLIDSRDTSPSPPFLGRDFDLPAVRPYFAGTVPGFDSLDAVVLCTAIQEDYQTPMPFAELPAEIGQQQRDLSIAELVHSNVGNPVGISFL